jgi:CDP-diacylglycerol--glycerol-3-phosphate 3-phosphatidyltransferase
MTASPTPPVVSRVRRFGPSALATPANAATAARVVFTLPLLAYIARHGASWLAVTAWVTLGSTDGLDGWLARRDGTTRSGAFLDPLADKFLTIGGLIALVSRDVFPVVPVALIALREIAVSLYRSAAGRRGISLPARQLGKVKTVCQLVAVGFALLPTTAHSHGLLLTVLWLAVVLTWISGLEIFRRGWIETHTEP